MPSSQGSTNSDSAREFLGPVLFVNHSATNMKARPHRHQVFTHVQSNYRRWKRREDSKFIRSSTQSSDTSKSSKHKRTSSTPDQSSMISVFMLTPPGSDGEVKNEDYSVANAIQRSISPMTPVSRGNSDPFQSWSFTITPQVNDLIKFYRDWILPSMYHTDSRKAIVSKSALRDYADTVAGLQDEAGAYAFLARNAFVASKSNPAMRRTAAEYFGKSTVLLTKKLAKGNDVIQSPTTYWHINNLWAAETIDKNLAGATAHGKMVKYMIDQQIKMGKLDVKQLMYVVYTDCQMSATFLIPPIFDVEEWLPKTVAPVWTMATRAVEALLPNLPVKAEIDASIAETDLASILLVRRETTEVWMASRSLAQTSEVEQSPLIFLYIMFRAVITQGQLMNYYLRQKTRLADLRAQMQTRTQVATDLLQSGERRRTSISSNPAQFSSSSTSSIEEQIDTAYAHAYIALATIYLTRIWSFNVTVLGQPMFNAGPNILSHLRKILEESDRFPGGASFHKFNNARFWALYVGALGEMIDARNADRRVSESGDARRGKGGRDGKNIGAGWANKKMAEQAYVCDIKTWQEARSVLEGFIYNDALPPHLSTWFEESLRMRGVSA